MQKSEAKVKVALKVSAKQAWDVIGSASGVDKWFPSVIKSCRVENGKRFCETTEGIPLIEDIIEINHEKRIFRFAIPKQEMMPVENIFETMAVTDGENGLAVGEWSGSWNVSSENESSMKDAFVGLWTMGLKELEAYIINSNN